jgi:hypothetical protein
MPLILSKFVFTMDDDELHLSHHALLALQEFYKEQKEQEERFEALKKQVEQQHTMDVFQEDWQLSQFWVRCRVRVDKSSTRMKRRWNWRVKH